MNKKLKVLSGGLLLALPLLNAMSSSVSAYSHHPRHHGFGRYHNHYRNNYRPGYNNWGYNYGYNNWGYNNWGRNNWGYNNWDYDYGYNNWGRNNWGYDYGYNNWEDNSRYTYWNGKLYYQDDYGVYYVYQNNRWVRVNYDTTPSNPTPKPEQPTTPTPKPEQPANPTPKPEQPTTPTPKPEQPANPTPKPEQPANPTPKPEQPATPTPEQPATPTPKPEQPATPGNGSTYIENGSENHSSEFNINGNGTGNGSTFIGDGNIPELEIQPGTDTETNETPTTPDNSSTPVTPSTPTDSNAGRQNLGWAPERRAIPKPPGKPGSRALRKDPKYKYEDGEHRYYLSLTPEKDGLDGYWIWWTDEKRWKLVGQTDPNDPNLNPANHREHTNHEYDYDYDNQASTDKINTDVVIGTGRDGDALPFGNAKEFQDYVIRQHNPIFKDNKGYDCLVTYTSELTDDFLATARDNGWARDYVLTANITLDNSNKYELGTIRYIYRVKPNTRRGFYQNTNKAKEAFDKINEARTAAGLNPLTWSESIYTSQGVPGANAIAKSYDSSVGVVFRREEDPAKVVDKWLANANRELVLDPNISQGSVTCVQTGDATYYWIFNSK